MATVTPQVATIRAMVDAQARVRRWQLSDLGAHNCRRIRGQYATGNAWSQHAWGNAWDVGATPAVLDELEEWAKRSKSRGDLRGTLGTILRYDDHLHLEGADKRSGTPPCAGGAADPDALPDVDPGPIGAPDDPTIDPDDLPGPLPGIEGLQTAAERTRQTVELLAFVLNPANWRRVALGLLGIALIVVGLVVINRDAIGGAARTVASAAPGATA